MRDDDAHDAHHGDGAGAGPTKGGRKIGRFRSPAARDSFLAAYDRNLACWPAVPEHRDVPTRFGRTHVLVAGSTTGPPIVLLHAVAVSSPSWAASIGALGASHPVFAIDTIGDAGRSIQTREVRSAADAALWLDDVVTALGLDEVHLVGLSYGGWLALNQARHSPGRLRSVVSIDPPGAIGRPRGSFIIKLLPDGALAKFGRSDKALHRLLGMLNNGAPPDQPLLDLCVTGLRSFRVRQPAPKRFSDDDLGSITTPTLLIFGERSPVNRADRASERSRLHIPDVEAEVIPGAGHMIPIEASDVFAGLVLRFTGDIDARRSDHR